MNKCDHQYGKIKSVIFIEDSSHIMSAKIRKHKRIREFERLGFSKEKAIEAVNVFYNY